MDAHLSLDKAKAFGTRRWYAKVRLETAALRAMGEHSSIRSVCIPCSLWDRLCKQGCRRVGSSSKRCIRAAIESMPQHGELLVARDIALRDSWSRQALIPRA